MPYLSKEILALRRLCCCFKVFFLLGILLRTSDMVVLEESSLELYSKKILTDLKIVIRVTGMLCICLMLHILSSKHFAESFGAFFSF